MGGKEEGVIEMEWSKLYGENSQPSLEDVSKYINSGLWDDLASFLEGTCKTQPKFSYSKESHAWNLKYRKSGKSLCTLYPMDGFFIALVVIGNKETPETELVLPACTEYVQNLYRNTRFMLGGRWLMIHVTDTAILVDVKNLIGIKSNIK